MINLAGTASTVYSKEEAHSRATACLNASMKPDLIPSVPDELVARAKEHFDAEHGKEVLRAGEIKCQIVAHLNRLICGP